MISKKIAIVSFIATFLIATLGSYLYFSKSGYSPVVVKYKSPGSGEDVSGTVTQGPKTEVCPINGAYRTRSQQNIWEGRRPMGVMIENHTDARPQSGLSNADIIYEAVAEGGITRFLAIFYCQDAKIIGPVRSARIYFLQILEEYGDHPLYAHVGGANTPGPADALGEIRDLGWDGYNDMNQFGVPFPYYYRDYERLPDRATEHTMYASTAKLWDYAKKDRKLTSVDSKGKKWNARFTSWKFRDEAKIEDRGTVSKISFGFWDQFANDYAIVWNWDRASNTYKRINGGKPHTDKDTGKQLETKNVFVIMAHESPANDGYPGGHLLYKVVGSGEGLFFQDGKVTKGTWKKTDEKSRMKFYDETGRELEVVRGQVFVEILPTGNKVIY